MKTCKIKNKRSGSSSVNSFVSLHAMSTAELRSSVNRCIRKLKGLEPTFLLQTTIRKALTQYSHELYIRHAIKSINKKNTSYHENKSGSQSKNGRF